MHLSRIYFVCALLFATSIVLAQDPLRLQNEVNKLVLSDSAVNNKKLILFTGSSSIRFWGDIKAYYPEYNAVNRGFGGSVTSDLIYYFDKLILPHHPKQIYIYEGDNDLAGGKSPEQILADTDSLLKLIRTKVSRKVPVLFISPKPSLARWKLKEQYIAYNRMLQDWTKKQKNVKYIDVWTPLLDASSGQPKSDIFIEDGLHLNKKGYEIWAATIKPYLP
jgi:lysophospholipase L1-like esterase